MGEMITITSKDGTTLSAYQATPKEDPCGGLVVLQEIFGLNSHIRSVCDSFAEDGWLVIAPALFDPARPDVQLSYNADGIAQGRALKEQVDERAEMDIASTLALFDEGLKRGVVGYCWGGSLAWRMACHHNILDGSICYYGGELPALRTLKSCCPVMAHFGRLDASIPIDKVEDFIAAQPNLDCHLYDADHGFNCDQRGQYNAENAALARQRTDEFLAEHIRNQT